MPSPKDKKAAQVNMNNFSNKEAEESNFSNKEEKVKVPDWVEQAKSEIPEQEPTPVEKYRGKVDERLVTNEQPTPVEKYRGKVDERLVTNEQPTPELTFGSTSKRQNDTNKQAQAIVNKVAIGETPTEEESENAQSRLSDLKQQYSDERMKALAETQPDKFNTIATIMSALVTAATGGAIPFIPFNAITGNDQKIAYFNKINATYASQMNDLALDANKLEYQRAKEATSTDETLKNAQQMAKEEGARKTDADVYKAEKDKQNREDLMKLDNELKKDFSNLTAEHQQSLMSVAQDLQNKSQAEAMRYLQNEITSGKYSNEEIKSMATVLNAYKNGMTPSQVAATTANAWVTAGTNIVNSVGGVLHGK